MGGVDVSMDRTDRNNLFLQPKFAYARGLCYLRNEALITSWWRAT